MTSFLVFHIIYSHSYRMFGSLAQSVEQRTVNPCVAGSSPAGAVNPVKLLGYFFLNKPDFYKQKIQK